MFLTASGPVLGAIAAGDTKFYDLIILFLIGCLGHIYGFTQNDVVDYRIDLSSKDIQDRPLISGTINRRKATLFYITAGVIAYIISYAYFRSVYSMVFLFLSTLGITLYNYTSKKYPFMDILDSSSVGLFIIFGAAAAGHIDNLVITVSTIGAIQVFFMNGMIGGLKDLPNDFVNKAKTAAIYLGMRVDNGKIVWSRKFRVYGIIPMILWYIMAFMIIYYAIDAGLHISILQIFLVSIIMVLLAFISYRILTVEIFDRGWLRKTIGLHYMINYITTPIILASITAWTYIFLLLPPIGFILSNIILHGTVMAPKTM